MPIFYFDNLHLVLDQDISQSSLGPTGVWTFVSAPTPGSTPMIISKTPAPEKVSTLGDVPSVFVLMSKIPPLGSTLNFDNDVKK